MSKETVMEPNKVKEGGVGLSYPMQARGNYTVWSLEMKVYMQAHGVGVGSTRTQGS